MASGKAPNVITCSDGAWNWPTLTCTASCGEPLLNESFTVGESGTSEGATRGVMCAEGYEVASGKAPSVITCSDGAWSSPTLNCTPLGVQVRQRDARRDDDAATGLFKIFLAASVVILSAAGARGVIKDAEADRKTKDAERKARARAKAKKA